MPPLGEGRASTTVPQDCSADTVLNNTSPAFASVASSICASYMRRLALPR